MHAILLDTDVWSWTLLGTDRLTAAARAAVDNTPNRYLSPVSLYEVGQNAQLGKWPEMVAALPRLRSSAEAQGLAWALVDPDICALAGTMAWSHRDPFDRMIAAQALAEGVPVVTRDKAFPAFGCAVLW